MLELIIVPAILAFFLFWILKPDPLSSIPGPEPHPIFGSIKQFNPKQTFLSFHKFYQKYGGIIKVYFFRTPKIFVSSRDMIYESLVKSEDISGRPQTYRISLLHDGQEGIIALDPGDKLKQHRRLLQIFLKQFGVGMQRLEDHTVAAANDMIQKLQLQNGCPLDVRKFLFRCTLDVIVVMLKGTKIESESTVEEIKVIFDQVIMALSRDVSGTLFDLFPFLRFFGNKTYNRIQAALHMRNTLIKSWMDSAPNEGFIHHMKSLSSEEKQQHQIVDDLHQINILWDFMLAGVFTTSTTLTCLFNVLVHRPNIQKKLRDELYSVVKGRQPSIKDREKMPYHRAVILEIGRFASIVPLSVPHCAVRDTTLGEYQIPKGTVVHTNLWSMHHDEKLWEDPFEFVPERFLDADGELVLADHPNRKNTMPFGAGQRVCVGEQFALSRMFLILAMVLQKFRILPESSIEAQPSMDPCDMLSLGSAILPPPYKVRLESIL